jgi:hypothetical protein
MFLLIISRPGPRREHRFQQFSSIRDCYGDYLITAIVYGAITKQLPHYFPVEDVRVTHNIKPDTPVRVLLLDLKMNAAGVHVACHVAQISTAVGTYE